MDLESLTDDDRVTLLQQAFASVDDLCGQFDDADWDKPTDLEGWTVKDNLSHIVSFESAAIGRPLAPKDVDVSRYAYAKDPFQIANEREVEARRGRTGAEVLAEYREVIAERIKALETLDQSTESRAEDTPVGLVLEWRRFLPIRISDVFYHEQDMRRATGRPGHLNGAVGQMVYERVGRTAMARVVAKEAGLPEGAVVAFDVGTPGQPFGVVVKGGRGELIELPEKADVRVAADFEAFLMLVGGRRGVAALQGDGRLHVDGDLAPALLERIVVIP